MSRKILEKSDKRERGRHQVQSLMPLKMSLKDGGLLFACRIDDVSSDGLGILTARQLEPGTAVVFETLEGCFNFVVAWHRDVERHEHRCGLMLTDEGIDLRSMFSRFIPRA